MMISPQSVPREVFLINKRVFWGVEEIRLEKAVLDLRNNIPRSMENPPRCKGADKILLGLAKRRIQISGNLLGLTRQDRHEYQWEVRSSMPG